MLVRFGTMTVITGNMFYKKRLSFGCKDYTKELKTVECSSTSIICYDPISS